MISKRQTLTTCHRMVSQIQVIALLFLSWCLARCLQGRRQNMLSSWTVYTLVSPHSKTAMNLKYCQLKLCTERICMKYLTKSISKLSFLYRKILLQKINEKQNIKNTKTIYRNYSTPPPPIT